MLITAPAVRASEERRTARILSTDTHTPHHYDRSFHRLGCARSETPEPFNGACNGFPFLRFIGYFKLSSFLSLPKLKQLSKLAGARRCNSTGTEPPPAGGHLPSVATSKILRTTREAALRTPGIKWLDEDGNSPLQSTIGGRETRKMNLYQAVRDAMGCANCHSYVMTAAQALSELLLQEMIQPLSLAKMLLLVVCSGAPW